MGIMNFLFGSKSKKEPTHNKDLEILQSLRNEREELKMKLDDSSAQNNAWQLDFNHLISLREKATEYEKNGKLDLALSVYLISIQDAENSSHLTIHNYAHDIDRVIIIYGKTKQKNLLIPFLEEKIEKHLGFRGVEDWTVRLSKLKGVIKKPDKFINIGEIEFQEASNPTLGNRIDMFKDSMPDFNFYYDMPENGDTLGYNHNVPFELFKKLREFREAFETIKSLAKIAENEGDYKMAIEAYNRLIIEEYDGPTPFERLMVIYSKLKMKEAEKQIVECAILVFTRLKEKQFNHVISLSKKYGMEEKALEYIRQDKKIFYYGGAFELYNPQTTRLQKWKTRLEKLNK